MDICTASRENAQQILEDMYKQRNRDGNYIMPRDQPERTIILLGRRGVGKTTISNVINDSLYYSSSTLRLETKQSVTQMINGLHIVDTPNIFDDRNQPSKLKINNCGITICDSKISLHDDVFPLFGFVFSVQGVSSDDIEAMLNFKYQFAQCSPNIILILTHCEEKTESQRLQLIDEFFDNSQLVKGNMRDFFGRGFLCMGCLRNESVEAANRKALIFEHQQVLQMRADFIRRCEDNEQVILISDVHEQLSVQYFYSHLRSLINRYKSYFYLGITCSILAVATKFIYEKCYLRLSPSPLPPPRSVIPSVILPILPPHPIANLQEHVSTIFFERGIFYGSYDDNFSFPLCVFTYLNK